MIDNSECQKCRKSIFDKDVDYPMNTMRVALVGDLPAYLCERCRDLHNEACNEGRLRFVFEDYDLKKCELTAAMASGSGSNTEYIHGLYLEAKRNLREETRRWLATPLESE